MSAFDGSAIPAELRERRQWICWQAVPKGNGKVDKVPIDPVTGGRLKWSEPSSWLEFTEACRLADASVHAAGVGFVLTKDDPYVLVDLDTDGHLADWQQAIWRGLNSYAEWSPSGKGVHVFVRAEVARAYVTKPGLEIYGSGRFSTFTGRVVNGAPRGIRDANGTLAAIIESHYPEPVAPKPKASTRTNGAAKASPVAGGGRWPEGSRNNRLTSIVGTLQRQGVPAPIIEKLAGTINAEVCASPLSADEVATIVSSVGRYAPDPEGPDWDGIDLSDPEGEPGRGALPELPDMAAFFATKFPPREPLLGPIHSSFIVHISGETGAGKTNLAVAVSRALGTCTDWCHWRAHDRRIVLHVDGELPPGDLQGRFSNQKVPDDAWIVPLSAIWLAEQPGFELGHVNLAEVRWQRVIEHYLERYGATVLSLDNVMSLIFVEGASMSEDKFWRPVSPWLRRLRGQGITSIVWDHTNDQGRTYGTKTKEWQADLAIQIVRPDDHEAEDGCRFTMRFGKTRGLHGAEVREMDVRLENGVWRAESSVNIDRERARQMRADGMSVRDIARSLERSLGWVAKHTKKASNGAGF